MRLWVVEWRRDRQWWPISEDFVFTSRALARAGMQARRQLWPGLAMRIRPYVRKETR